MKKLWETGILLFAVMGFWGMIYPDLCFISDVCNVEYKYVSEDNYGQSVDAKDEQTLRTQGIGAESSLEMERRERDDSVWEPDIYTRICEAQPEQIRVKSRLLELFQK